MVPPRVPVRLKTKHRIYNQLACKRDHEGRAVTDRQHGAVYYDGGLSTQGYFVAHKPRGTHSTAHGEMEREGREPGTAQGAWVSAWVWMGLCIERNVLMQVRSSAGRTELFPTHIHLPHHRTPLPPLPIKVRG